MSSTKLDLSGTQEGPTTTAAFWTAAQARSTSPRPLCPCTARRRSTTCCCPWSPRGASTRLTGTSLSSATRPTLDRNVFVVCNEANRGRFMQEETGFSDRAWSSGGMRLRRENVISNHASAPAEWAGEGGDLQAALRSGLLDPGADLLVVRGSMLLLPDYNFSRVVEHALVHSCNCVAYAQACGRRADLMRWRPSPPFVLEVEKPGSSSSRIAQASRRAPREGEYGAVGLALLKAAEIQQAALGAVEDAWLEEVALRPLMDGRCASGIDLQAGHFSVATLAGWSYADALFDTYAFTLEQDRRLAKCDRRAPPSRTVQAVGPGRFERTEGQLG
uniref:Uncharacterized protein n=1 Tax=Tetraselmis sp. GSL018 TaxID=582737 RepID=A0A061RPB1_9CHLO